MGVGASLWINPAFGRYSQRVARSRPTCRQRGTLVSVEVVAWWRALMTIGFMGGLQIVNRNRVADGLSAATLGRPQLMVAFGEVLDRCMEAMRSHCSNIEFTDRPVGVDPQLSRTGHRNDRRPCPAAGRIRPAPVHSSCCGFQAVQVAAPGFGAIQPAQPTALDVRHPVDQGCDVAPHPLATGGEYKALIRS